MGEHHRVAIIGAGFGGIGASVALARQGVGHVLFERAPELGGTWRDNHYPGCRCDVPSHLYSFSFALNPDWSESYSPQPEIQAYLRRVAGEFGVTNRIRFSHDVLEASWHAAGARWRITTSVGEHTADVLILANGPLAEPAFPDLPGMDRFEGAAFHSARWRDDHDLSGQRVAVIGTGASAIQIVPAIQPIVRHLTIFQRTAPWVVPHRNRRITDLERSLYRRVPPAQRLVRDGIYWSREVLAAPLLRNGRLLRRLERLARDHIAAQVGDPCLRAKLMPDYRPGCKRLLPSDDWYPAIQQPNVELVTDKLVEVGSDHLVTAEGRRVPVDTIVYATGFRVTDNPVADRIQGSDGRTLAEHWSATGMRAYLGTTVSGFPNLFMLAGPNTGIGHTSLVFMIESQLPYVTGALAAMAKLGATTIELRQEVLDAWTREIQARAAPTVWNSGGCASWYLDSEGRNTAIWPDYTWRFRRRTRRFDTASYRLA